MDWHIWISHGPRLTRYHAVVVEASPRIRVNHPGWSVAKLRELARSGTRIRVSGWLMLDQEHPEQLHQMSHRNRTRWTLWEVHPITAIEMWDGDRWQRLDEWQSQPSL